MRAKIGISASTQKIPVDKVKSSGRFCTKALKCIKFFKV